jgi:hypothetical protein
MNKSIEYYLAIFSLIILTVSAGCKKVKLSESAPEIKSIEVVNIKPEEAELNGSVNANYLTTAVTFEYSAYSGYDKTITADQSPVTGNADTRVSAHLTGLTAGLVYHFRIKAENSLGITYSRDTTFKTEYKIGQQIYGGIIFYIDSTGQHGLVCAPEDQAKLIDCAEWGCTGSIISGASGIDIGTGNQNTTDIVNSCSTQKIAARICYDLILNAYSDWYLPSKEELGLMYNNLKLIRLGGFANSYYWSSTEEKNSLPGQLAWMQAFDDGSRGGGFKSGKHNVRAIRAF